VIKRRLYWTLQIGGCTLFPHLRKTAKVDNRQDAVVDHTRAGKCVHTGFVRVLPEDAGEFFTGFV
jgi:hypothetical protein